MAEIKSNSGLHIPALVAGFVLTLCVCISFTTVGFLWLGGFQQLHIPDLIGRLSGRESEPLPSESPVSDWSVAATPTPGMSTAKPISSEAYLTNWQGEVVIEDPVTTHEVLIQALDANTHQPLQGITIVLISDGKKLLVFAVDPNSLYLPEILEVPSEEQSMPYLQGSIRRVSFGWPIILLLKSLDLFSTLKELYELEKRSDIPLERWGFLTQDYCVDSDAVIASGVIGTEPYTIFLPDFGWMKKLQAMTTAEIYSGLLVLKELGEQHATDSISRLIIQALQSNLPPAILRFRVYSIDGFPIGLPAVPIGYCLEPLDRTDTQSLLGWVTYGLDRQGKFVFSKLIPETNPQFDSVLYGGMATEPSGQLSYSEFQKELGQRLRSGAKCLSYTIEDLDLIIFTYGWGVPWILNPLPDTRVVGFDFSRMANEREMFLHVFFLDPAEDDASSPFYQPYLREKIRNGIACSELGARVLKGLNQKPELDSYFAQIQSGLEQGSPDFLDALIADQVYIGPGCCSNESLSSQQWVSKEDALSSIKNDWNYEKPSSCLGFIYQQEAGPPLYQKKLIKKLSVFLDNHKILVFTDALSPGFTLTEYYFLPLDVDPPSDTIQCPTPQPTSTPPIDQTRQKILERARIWMDNSVAYGLFDDNPENDLWNGYRTDCSGFISYAWGLPAPGAVTDNLLGGTYARPITISELQPGDALNNNRPGSSGHIVLFINWLDQSRTRFAAYDMNISPGYATEKTFTLEQLPDGNWTIPELDLFTRGPYQAQRLISLP